MERLARTQLKSGTISQCPGIQPEPGEGFRTEYAFGIGRQLDETSLAQEKPENFVGVKRTDNVLENASALIIVELGTEIGVTGCMRDFDDQFGNPADEPPVGLGTPAVLGQDTELHIGLWLSPDMSTVDVLSRTSTPGVFSW